jgi:cellulose biosynthesis protein BcsQ
VNFKGGVGKTTICANLAGHFAHAGRRVLLIDFDYQGSLSDTLLQHAGIREVKPTSHRLIEGADAPEQVHAIAERLSSLSGNLWLYPAFYTLNRIETHVMFRWLVGKDLENRFDLSDYLQSEIFQTDAQSCFDIVLIDCPPRLLTASVNALAASTHVLVPTILDGQSLNATINTLSAIQQFRQRLNKNLRTLGVVPSMVVNSTGYNERELDAIQELERQINEVHNLVPVLKDRQICRKEQLARAGGNEVVYFSTSNDERTQEIRRMFSHLADYIEQNVNWKQRDMGRVVTIPGVHDENRGFASGS